MIAAIPVENISKSERTFGPIGFMRPTWPSAETRSRGGSIGRPPSLQRTDRIGSGIRRLTGEWLRAARIATTDGFP